MGLQWIKYIHIQVGKCPQKNEDGRAWTGKIFDPIWTQCLHFPPLLFIASPFSAFTHFPGFVVLSMSRVSVPAPPWDASLQSSLSPAAIASYWCMAPSRGKIGQLSGSVWHHCIWDPYWGENKALNCLFVFSLLYFSLDSKSHTLKEIRVPILIISPKEQEMHVQIETETGSISQEQEGLRGAFYYERSTDASFSSVIQREKYKCASKKKKGKNKLKRRKKRFLWRGVEICELFQAHTFYYVINTSLLI